MLKAMARESGRPLQAVHDEVMRKAKDQHITAKRVLEGKKTVTGGCS
jgi:hypothetical protein